jgi:hypothetical protein
LSGICQELKRHLKIPTKNDTGGGFCSHLFLKIKKVLKPLILLAIIKKWWRRRELNPAEIFAPVRITA